MKVGTLAERSRLPLLTSLANLHQCSKWSPFCLGTCMKASAPLPDCSIDKALVHFFLHCFDALAQLINVFNSALINLTTAL